MKLICICLCLYANMTFSMNFNNQQIPGSANLNVPLNTYMSTQTAPYCQEIIIANEPTYRLGIRLIDAGTLIKMGLENKVNTNENTGQNDSKTIKLPCYTRLENSVDSKKKAAKIDKAQNQKEKNKSTKK